jgi:glycosyltransferase involved in cell wall biosynthesis
MKADRLSVIIPAYNAEATIEQAIRSAFDQSPAPHEVVVGDDGSTDDTAKIAEGAGAIVLRLPRGNGSIARNRAVEASTGNLLFFLDADDWWTPGKLQAHVQAWQRHDVGFIVDVATKISPDGTPQGPLGAGPEGLVAWEKYLLWTTWTSGSSFSVPKEHYSALGGFNETLLSQQDVDFWVRCAHAYNGAYRIGQSYTCYRLSPGGVSKQPKDVAANLERLLGTWPFATSEQKREFFQQMALTAAGFTRFPASLQYFKLAGWPLTRGKFYRALARSLMRTARP